MSFEALREYVCRILRKLSRRRTVTRSYGRDAEVVCDAECLERAHSVEIERLRKTHIYVFRQLP